MMSDTGQGSYRTRSTAELKALLVELREEIALVETIPDSTSRRYEKDCLKKVETILKILETRND